MASLPKAGIWQGIVCFVLLLVSTACAPLGGTINVNGLSFDVVTIQRASPVHPGVCCFPRPFGDCFDFRVTVLDRNGFGAVSEMVDEMSYIGFSVFSGCVGEVRLPCSGVRTMDCVTLVPPSVAIGTLTIVGPGIECVPMGGFREICNNTWVKVTIEGVQVSVQALDGSTASSIALDLATKISLNPDLWPIVSATVSGNIVTVSAKNEGVEYAFPWQGSCTYVSTFFSECSFQAELSPIATLAPSAE